MDKVMMLFGSKYSEQNMANKITGVLNYQGLLMVLDYGNTSGINGMISLRISNARWVSGESYQNLERPMAP